MKQVKFLLAMLSACMIISCGQKDASDIPVIGYADAFEDETLAQARTGFFDALSAAGFSESDGTVKVIQRNAQGDIPALTQIISYFIAQKVDLIGTNPTITTITAVQKTKAIPIFMMVAGTPENMQVLQKDGSAPANLYGIYETLDYIDTSFLMIASLLPVEGRKIRIGMIYNQAEPQSVSALQRIESLANKNNMEVIALPINNSADAQIVTQSLLSKNIDAFFANPDNTVFASFETIVKNCNASKVPVFTSEAGLVKRGGVAAFGADLYQWGYQAGQQAAIFLKQGNADGLQPEPVLLRKKIYNPEAAALYGLSFPEDFVAL